MSDDQLTINGLAKGLALLIEAIRESNQGQRQRLLIMDSQLRALNELADRLEAVEARLAGACQVCARLNILCSPIGTKEQGPPDDAEEQEIEKKLADWH